MYLLSCHRLVSLIETMINISVAMVGWSLLINLAGYDFLESSHFSFKFI